MTRVELTIPDKLSKIDSTLRDEMLVGAIRDVASVQLRGKEEELEEAKIHIREFEGKYKKKLKFFEKEFPKDAGHKLHEDLIEWSFWNDVFEKIQKLVNDLRFVLGKSYEENP